MSVTVTCQHRLIYKVSYARYGNTNHPRVVGFGVKVGQLSKRPHAGCATGTSSGIQRNRFPAGPVKSSVAPDGTFDVDKLDVDSLELEDPFGIVEDVMTSTNLRYATPHQPLASAASKLDKVTGLAVIDDDSLVVGVISIKVGRSFYRCF